MATLGYFAHDSPTGITPWHWFREVGYTFLYAGENLAINFIDATEIRDAWLASPTHRANLLDVKFKEIGMATVSGVYKDGPAIYVVQMFGTPAKAAAAASAATTSAIMVTETKPITDTSLAQAPEIKGQSTGTPLPVLPEIAKPILEPIITEPDLAVVKNNENVEPIVGQAGAATYSRWYERFLFGGSYYVDMAYKALIALVFVALLTMILIEVRKQHWKHITYGLAVLLILTLSLLVNQSFF
jgi:hypothetical protein